MVRTIFLLFFCVWHITYANVTQAKQAIVIDAETGQVLFEHNSEELMVPSSMTKIATAMLAFRELENGNIKESDLLLVSKNAWKKGGSRMFVEEGTMVRVMDLLKGVIVQSGNDASIVLAEGLYGNEAICATEMTRFIHNIGASKTSFKNVTGWPDPNHLSTALDLAIITRNMIKQYPTLYAKYFPIKEYTYNNIRQQNRNPLLFKSDLQSDGVKTGHTVEGGYGLVGTSVAKDGSRYIVVVNGLKTSGERDRESHGLLKWAEQSFTTQKILSKGKVVHTTDLWLASKKSVNLIAAEDLYITLKRDDLAKTKVIIRHQSPVCVKKFHQGDVLGTIEIILPDNTSHSAKLLMEESVPQADFFTRIYSALHYILLGHNK